jgi:hypothetical protein
MRQKFRGFAVALSAVLATTASRVVPALADEATAPAAAEHGAPDEGLTVVPDRPGFGDSTGVTPVGHFELELGYRFEYFDHGDTQSRTHDVPEALVRFGVLDDGLELRLETDGYEYSRSVNGSESDTQSGFNDLQVGCKVKLSDQRQYLPNIALVVSTTVGVGSRKVSDRDVQPTIELTWDKDVGHGVDISGSGAARYSNTAGDHFVQGAGSVLVGYAVSDQIGWFAEYFFISPNANDSATANYADFGATYLLTKRIQLDGTVGFGLNRVSKNFFTEPGITVLF